MQKKVALVLSNGSCVEERDLAEQTPLHHACDWNYPELVQLLLKKGADVNAADDHGFTPFLVAAGWGREIIVELLLSKKVKIRATDSQGNNVFHICGASGQANVMKTLIQVYSQESLPLLLAKNLWGWTPLDFSTRCGHFEATKVLVYAVVKYTTAKVDTTSFIHMRFNIIPKEDLDLKERYLCRFVDQNSDRACFRIPRCKWYIQSPGKEEYDNVLQFINKYEDKLRARHAKS